MELDPEWYAYQCKSGEVLFFYNTITGEHRWAIHFCSCLKSKIANSTTEPCCLWEPVKSRTSESGKFVRSIGTETEDQYFSEIHRDFQPNEELTDPSRTEITFEYSVSKDKLIEDETSGNSYHDSINEKPVEVFLEDPFVPSSDKQKVSSKRLTLKLKEISRQEFSLPENVIPKKVSKRVDDLTFPRKSLTVSKNGPVACITQGEKDPQETSPSEKVSFVGQMKDQQLSSAKKQHLTSSSSLKMSTPCQDNKKEDDETLLDNLQLKRQRGSASSRKNPEPRKLVLKRSNLAVSEQSAEERSEVDMQECFEDEPREKLFDGPEEHLLEEDTLVVVHGEPSSSTAETTALQQEGDFKDDSDDQTNVCELCGKECPTPAMLTNHLMKHQPTGTTCPICNKYFSRRQGLRYHVQTHSGDKPHVCTICNKTFTKSASLVAHIRTHSGIRPFKCPKCNKGFTHSSNLSSHLRIHSSLRPYQCKFCSKGFKTSSHLTLHLRSHSDERPYECSECGKAFKNSSHLRSHEKLHRIPKTVFCDNCGEGFRSFSHLMYHQQTNPQCSEEDGQEKSQVGQQMTHQQNRKEVKHEESHMEKQNAHQYSNMEIELGETSHMGKQRLETSTTNEMRHETSHMEEQETETQVVQTHPD